MAIYDGMGLVRETSATYMYLPIAYFIMPTRIKAVYNRELLIVTIV